MSGDYVERLETAYATRRAKVAGTRPDVVEVLSADLRSALDEREQLRTERSGKPETRCPALSTTRLRLQCSRPEGHDAAHVAELDGMGRFSWHGGA